MFSQKNKMPNSLSYLVITTRSLTWAWKLVLTAPLHPLSLGIFILVLRKLLFLHFLTDTLNLIFDCSQSGAIFGFKVTFPHSKPVCDTHINVPQAPHTQNAYSKVISLFRPPLLTLLPEAGNLTLSKGGAERRPHPLSLSQPSTRLSHQLLHWEPTPFLPQTLVIAISCVTCHRTSCISLLPPLSTGVL